MKTITKKAILISILILVFFSSCKKEIPGPSKNNPTSSSDSTCNRVVKMEYGSMKYDIKYDAQGRLIDAAGTTVEYKDKFTIYIKYSSTNTDTIILDNSGKAVLSKNGNSKTNYEYNSNNELIKETSEKLSGTTKSYSLTVYTWENGNRVKGESYDATKADFSDKYLNSVSTDQMSTTPNKSNLFYLWDFYGKHKFVTNPIRSSNTYYDKNGKQISNYITTYEYDSKDRVIKDISNQGDIFIYTYKCL